MSEDSNPASEPAPFAKKLLIFLILSIALLALIFIIGGFIGDDVPYEPGPDPAPAEETSG